MNFSLLIKPAAADCNLACEYCFYLNRRELYPESACHRMSEGVLEQTIRSYLQTPQPAHTFVWQGGEPLLMGESFFQRVTDLQMAYAASGRAEISNSVQTNAVLMTDRFARLFSAYRFLTGVSLDGPQHLHDSVRTYVTGEGSHELVLCGIDCLKRNRAEFNILTLVSKHNVHFPVELYDYLTGDIGSTFLQFIECVEIVGERLNGGAVVVAPYCVSPDEWGNFLCAIFDRWYEKDTHRVSVRLFDTIIAKLVTGHDICCTAGRDCRQYFVVEHNGDVYPCDFHVLPELKLGNVMTHKWDQMASSDIFRQFGARKSDTHAACKTCPFFRLCVGDCPKNRVGHIRGRANELSYLCAGWKQFYAYTLPRFEILAEMIRTRK